MGEPALKLDEKYTYKDLKTWPEDERWELIRGVPFAMSSPKIVHQRVLAKIFYQLMTHLEGQECEPFIAPVDVLFRDRADDTDDQIETVLIPDLIVVCDPGQVKPHGVLGPPAWVLEILSPSTSWRDLTEKREVYETHGVKEYWVLNPDTLDLTIYRWANGRFGTPIGATLREPVEIGLFPGLRLSLA